MPSRFQVFLAELRRRKVTRAAAAYLVIGFAVLEGAHNLREALEIPHAVIRALAILVIAGFPILLVLAWAFDITAEGIRKTRDLPDDPKISPWERAALLRRSGILGPLVVVGLTIVASFGVWSILESTVPTSPEPAPPPPSPRYTDSVAVMPLTNLTGNPSMEFLSMALAEEIIGELSQIRELKVTSRHSVEVLSQQNLTTPELADTLRVRHMVEGSIRLLNDSILRATVQHIDASTDAHLWSRNFDWNTRDMGGLYDSVADEVTRRVVAEIPGVFPPPDLGDDRGEAGLAAYQLGKHWLGRRTPEGLRRAITQFEQAVAEDPTHALALADLSSAYALALNYRYDVGADEYEMAARSLAAAEAAIRLAPDLAGGYASRGYLRAIVHAPVPEVRADFQRAAALQPNAASIPSWSARLLAMDGRNQEAFSEAQRAVELDPVASGRHIAVSSLSLHLGRYDDAIRAGEMATELEPELAMGKALVARAHLLRGEPELCASMELGPHVLVRAACLYEMGRGEEALAMVDSAKADLEAGRTRAPDFTDVLVMEDLATFCAWTGDADAALEWMERAFQESPAGFELRLYESALFDGIRDEPGFAQAADRLFQGRYEEVRRRAREMAFE